MGSEIWDDGKEPRGLKVRGESSVWAGTTFLQSPGLKRGCKGGRERRCCIPITSHCIANRRIELGKVRYYGSIFLNSRSPYTKTDLA